MAELKPLGTALRVLDAFRLLQKGVPVYIASAPEDEAAFLLKGAWRDEEGRIHFDRSTIYLQRSTALEVARAFRQECILALTPYTDAEDAVYLLKDTPLNRTIALRYAGGYTADGEYLLVAVKAGADLPVYVEGEHDMLPADVSFPAVLK
jgi:hypothetical protein